MPFPDAQVSENGILSNALEGHAEVRGIPPSSSSSAEQSRPLTIQEMDENPIITDGNKRKRNVNSYSDLIDTSFRYQSHQKTTSTKRGRGYEKKHVNREGPEGVKVGERDKANMNVNSTALSSSSSSSSRSNHGSSLPPDVDQGIIVDSSHSSHAVSKKIPKSRKTVRNKNATGGGMTVAARKQIEENKKIQQQQLEIQESEDDEFIKKAHSYEKYRNSAPKPLNAEPSDAMTLDEAIKFSVKDCNALLLDWSLDGAKIIGSVCKVYWDGDDIWFYGRVISYDVVTNKHRIHYQDDNASEWLNLQEEIVIVSCQFVLVSTGAGGRGIAWPAQRFWCSPKAKEKMKTMHGYKAAGTYIEYFTDSNRYEYGFPLASNIYEMNEKFFPKKPSKAFQHSLVLAEQEKKMIAAVIQDLVLLTKNALYKDHFKNKLGWIGRRVDAIFKEEKVIELDTDNSKNNNKEKKNESDINNFLSNEVNGADYSGKIDTEELSKDRPHRRQQTSSRLYGTDRVPEVVPKTVTHVETSKHRGIVAQYCSGSDMHLIVFDSSDVRPKWTKLGWDTVEVFVGPYERDLGAPIDNATPAYLQKRSIDSQDLNECCLCGSTASQSEIRHCVSCGLFVHDYCMPQTLYYENIGELLPEVQVKTMEPKSYNTLTEENQIKAALFNLSPDRCKKGSENNLNGIEKKENGNDKMETVPVLSPSPIKLHEEWKCWRCIGCESCGASFWDIRLKRMDLHRVDNNIVKGTVQTICGLCLGRYKKEKDYCPICYHLYSPDDDYEEDLKKLPIETATTTTTCQSTATMDNVTICQEVSAKETSELASAQGGKSNEITTAENKEVPIDLKNVDAAFTDNDNSMSEKEVGVDSSLTLPSGSSILPSQEDPSNTTNDQKCDDVPTTNEITKKENDANDQPNGSTKNIETTDTSLPIAIENICSSNKQVGELDSNEMVQCNQCSRWVHAMCEGIDQKQYEAMTNGTHPVWGFEYLCPICRVEIAKSTVSKLKSLDTTHLFALPVTDTIAFGYSDIVHNPMDLQTMGLKAGRGQYKSLQLLRQDFELMCMNAIDFNKTGDEYWTDAVNFYEKGKELFSTMNRVTTTSAYGVELIEMVNEYKAKEAEAKSKFEQEQRIQKEREQKLRAEKMKQSAKSGSTLLAENPYAIPRGNRRLVPPPTSASSIDVDGELSKNVISEIDGSNKEDSAAVILNEKENSNSNQLFDDIMVTTRLSSPPEPTNYLPSYANIVSAEESFFLSFVDVCVACGSSGCSENFLFCVDCGECAHSFCVEAPLRSMDKQTRFKWRCVNCKVCESENCNVPKDSEDWTRLIFCDLCDQTFHLNCLSPPLKDFPDEAWFCEKCSDLSRSNHCCPSCKALDALSPDDRIIHIMCHEIVCAVETKHKEDSDEDAIMIWQTTGIEKDDQEVNTVTLNSWSPESSCLRCTALCRNKEKNVSSMLQMKVSRPAPNLDRINNAVEGNKDNDETDIVTKDAAASTSAAHSQKESVDIVCDNHGDNVVINDGSNKSFEGVVKTEFDEIGKETESLPLQTTMVAIEGAMDIGGPSPLTTQLPVIQSSIVPTTTSDNNNSDPLKVLSNSESKPGFDGSQRSVENKVTSELAVDYVQQVQNEFKDRPEINDEFVRSVHAYRDREITTAEFVKKVRFLFAGKPHLMVGLNSFLPPEDKIRPDEISPEQYSRISKLMEEIRVLCNRKLNLEVQYQQRKKDRKKSGKSTNFWESDEAYCRVCSKFCGDTFLSCSRCKAYMHPRCAPLEYCLSSGTNLDPERYWSSLVSESILCPQCTVGIIGSRPLSHIGQIDHDKWKILDKVSLIQRNRNASIRLLENRKAQNLLLPDADQLDDFIDSIERIFLVVRWASFRYIFLDTRSRLHGIIGAGNSCFDMAVLSESNAWLTTKAIRFACKVKLLLKQHGDNVTWIKKGKNGKMTDESSAECTEMSLRRFRKLDPFFAELEKGVLNQRNCDVVSAGRLASMAASYLCVTSDQHYTIENDALLELVTLLPHFHKTPKLSYLVKDIDPEVSTKVAFLQRVQLMTAEVGPDASPVPMIAKFMESLVDSFLIPPVAVNAGAIPMIASIGKAGSLSNILHQWKSKGVSGQPLILPSPPPIPLIDTDSTFVTLSRVRRAIAEKQKELHARKTGTYQKKTSEKAKRERERKERERKERKEKLEREKRERREELLAEKRRKEEAAIMNAEAVRFSRKPPPDVYKSVETYGYYNGNDNKLERGFYSKQAIFHSLPPLLSSDKGVDISPTRIISTDTVDTNATTMIATDPINVRNGTKDLTRIMNERECMVIKPLRGWQRGNFAIHRDEISSFDWIDSRFCSICRLGEDDMVDTANLYGERVSLYPVVSAEHDNEERRDSKPNLSDSTNIKEETANSTADDTVVINDSTSIEVSPEVQEIYETDTKVAAPLNSNDMEIVDSSSITEVISSVDKSVPVLPTSMDTSAVANDANSTLTKNLSESDMSIDLETGSKRKSIKPMNYGEFVPHETQVWKRSKTKEELEEARKEKLRLESEMLKNDMYDQAQLRRSEDVYGRLIPMTDGTYNHINCIRWCRNIVERHGVLNNAIPLKENVYAARICTVCGQRRAVITCANKTCMKFFHYGCALSVGCVFAETKLSSEAVSAAHDIYTFMFCPIHKGDINSKPMDVLPDMAPTLPTANPLRAITTLDPSDFENSDGDVVAMISRRLIRSSFGLSFISATDNRAFRHGGLSSGGNAFKGTSHMLLVLGKEHIKENVPFQAAAALASEKPFAFSSALRAGTITVLELGTPRVGPGFGKFHTDSIIFPYGYRSARIFWSYKYPLSRTVYFFDILSLEDYHAQGMSGFDMEDVDPKDFEAEEAPSLTNPGESANLLDHISAEMPVFRVVAVDDPSSPIFARSIEKVFEIILQRIEKGYEERGTSIEARSFARAREMRKYPNDAYALTPGIFFGLGLAWIRRAIEMLPESVACMIAPPPFPQYRPCYVLPTKTDILRVQDFESHLMRSKRSSVSGCARADGWEVERKEVGTKVTRILAKTVNDEDDEKTIAASSTRPADDDRLINDDMYQEDLVESQRVIEQTRQKYKEMAASYLLDEHNLEVRRSKIHGWGLFARTSFNRGDLIVEYIGQKIRQAVADKRETVYEDEGVGSCYLFRLDKDDIVDATRTGGMARFMNHCCDPNAYAGIINIPEGTNPFPVDVACSEIGIPFPESFHGKHIVIFAGRDIQEGEEITYDYKFPIEEKKLRCYCGSSKCQGSMN